VGIGTNIFSIFEARGAGVKLQNLNEQPTDGDDFSMSRVYMMLVLDALLYGIIAW
jgi:hypothetical protein